MKKILLAVPIILLCLLLLPLLLYRTAQGMNAIGFSLLFFFVLYPALAIFLGILAGTDIKRLWWLPLCSALSFPPLFWIAISDVAWELYIYAALYVGLSVIAAAPTALIRYTADLKKKMQKP